MCARICTVHTDDHEAPSTKHQTPRTKSEDEARSSGRYLVFDTRCSMLDRHRAQRQARPTRLLSGRRSSVAKVHHPIMLPPRPDLGVRVGSIHIHSDSLYRPRRASPGLLEAGDACACSVVQFRSPSPMVHACRTRVVLCGWCVDACTTVSTARAARAAFSAIPGSPKVRGVLSTETSPIEDERARCEPYTAPRMTIEIQVESRRGRFRRLARRHSVGLLIGIPQFYRSPESRCQSPRIPSRLPLVGQAQVEIRGVRFMVVVPRCT